MEIKESKITKIVDKKIYNHFWTLARTSNKLSVKGETGNKRKKGSEGKSYKI